MLAAAVASEYQVLLEKLPSFSQFIYKLAGVFIKLMLKFYLLLKNPPYFHVSY